MPSNCQASPARGVDTIQLFFQDSIFIVSGNTDSPLTESTDSLDHARMLKGVLD